MDDDTAEQRSDAAGTERSAQVVSEDGAAEAVRAYCWGPVVDSSCQLPPF